MATGTFPSSNTSPAATGQSTGTLRPVSKAGPGGSLPPDNLDHYNLQQLAELASAAGFPQPALAASVAMAESGGNPNAVNQDSNGSHDTGLWQINSVHGYSDSQLKEPYYNVSAAKAVFDSSGWGAWSTYTSGAYKQYLSQATFEAQQVGALNTAGGFDPIGDVASAASSAANAVTGTAGTFATLAGNLTSGAFWVLVLKIIGGIILVLMGAYFLIKGNTNINIPKVPVE
jgi:Lysozyme like domain